MDGSQEASLVKVIYLDQRRGGSDDGPHRPGGASARLAKTPRLGAAEDGAFRLLRFRPRAAAPASTVHDRAA